MSSFEMLHQAQKEIGGWDVSDIDSPSTREDLIMWFDYIGRLKNRNMFMIDFVYGLVRPGTTKSSFNHPDAKWLVSLFTQSGQFVAGSERNIDAVLSKHIHDPRALFFRSFLFLEHEFEECDDMIRRSADMGYAPAQAMMSFCTMGDVSLYYAEKAAAQGDRDGMYIYSYRLSYEADWTTIVPNLLWSKRAADLGHVGAIRDYANHKFEIGDWRRCALLGKAAIRGDAVSRQILMEIAAEPPNERNSKLLFEIGAVSQKILDLGGCYLKNHRIFEQTAALYTSWRADANKAIFFWIWAGRQLGVVRDIRDVIAKMLWAEQREWSCIKKNVFELYL